MAKRLALSLAACLVALQFAQAAQAASPFKRLRLVEPYSSMGSDGVRFVFLGQTYGAVVPPLPVVFDTVGHRRFRLERPEPSCFPLGSYPGSGLFLWSCVAGEKVLIGDLVTGDVREPVGWDRARARFPDCYPSRVGRRWLEFQCGAGSCCESAPVYLDLRTGEVNDAVRFSDYVDLNSARLVRPICPPLNRDPRSPYFDAYEPPFALELDPPGEPTTAVNLRRCGSELVRALSRCRYATCVNPQLSSGYVTWGDASRVIVYVPRTRRRVVLRAPRRAIGYFLPDSVAHTCNRIYAAWGSDLYVARVKGQWGTRPCPAS